MENKCPKNCRKPKCKCGFRYVSIPAALGDDSKGSEVEPMNGAYCNALVVYKANNHIYLYSSDGVFVRLIDEDSQILTSPNGTQYKIAIADDGTLSTERIL